MVCEKNESVKEACKQSVCVLTFNKKTGPQVNKRQETETYNYYAQE